MVGATWGEVRKGKRERSKGKSGIRGESWLRVDDKQVKSLARKELCCHELKLCNSRDRPQFRAVNELKATRFAGYRSKQRKHRLELLIAIVYRQSSYSAGWYRTCSVNLSVLFLQAIVLDFLEHVIPQGRKVVWGLGRALGPHIRVKVLRGFSCPPRRGCGL